MKAVFLLVACLAGLAMSMKMDMVVNNNDFVTLDIKQRQMYILKLLNHVMDPLMYKDLEDIGRNFKLEDCLDMFTKPDLVKDFVKMMKVGFLPRGEIFTLHVDRQMTEVVSMFHMLYYAKDFNAFMRTACWMRLYFNEGMFVYALTVAVRHREDCRGIVLPPPYEIYPYYFVRADVIQKAYMLKMKRGVLDVKLCDFYGIKKTDKGVYIIDENVYDKRMYLNDEDRLRYFTEDIDLNTYYYYFHIDYPFWMRDTLHDKMRTRRFELTFYMYQQILARYYLERLSNGLGSIKEFSWDRVIKPGYWPWMILHNGVQMPSRFNNYVIVNDYNVNVVRLAKEYHSIIVEAITKGYIEFNGKRFEIMKYDDMEMLGKLVYGKMEYDGTQVDTFRMNAYRYFLVVMKAAVGLNTFTSSRYFVAPTILDQYQTALRDPVFYQLQKRIVDLLFLFKMRLPSYTKEELYFPGVRVNNMVVDKLITYFDDYLMDMTNAVVLCEEEMKKAKTDMVFMVRKKRLNHQPFTVTFDVLSDKNVDCVVRLFLGPKRDNFGRLLDINMNRVNFVELDSFVYKLVNGKNTIVRNSRDMHNIVNDRMMTRELFTKMETVADFGDMMKDLRNYVTGFPSRLLLPKGSVNGMEFMFYVIVTPLRMVDNMDMTMFDANNKEFMRGFRNTVYLDKMPLGYPLDRRIDVENFFTPNMLFKDVMIFHKQMTCDMSTRWNRWVLRDYNLLDKSSVDDLYSYMVDTDINMKVNRDMIINN